MVFLRPELKTRFDRPPVKAPKGSERGTERVRRLVFRLSTSLNLGLDKQAAPMYNEDSNRNYSQQMKRGGAGDVANTLENA
jgi:hypothetical protein